MSKVCAEPDPLAMRWARDMRRDSMASTPDAHPDSAPPEQSDDVETVSPAERLRPDLDDSPGSDGGTSGTGGTNHRGDRDITS